MSFSQQAAPAISEDRDHDMTVVEEGNNRLGAQLATPTNDPSTEVAVIGNQLGPPAGGGAQPQHSFALARPNTLDATHHNDPHAARKRSNADSGAPGPVVPAGHATKVRVVEKTQTDSTVSSLLAMVKSLATTVKEASERSLRAEARADEMQDVLSDLRAHLNRRGDGTQQAVGRESPDAERREIVAVVPQPPGAFVTSQVATEYPDEDADMTPQQERFIASQDQQSGPSGSQQKGSSAAPTTQQRGAFIMSEVDSEDEFFRETIRSTDKGKQKAGPVVDSEDEFFREAVRSTDKGKQKAGPVHFSASSSNSQSDDDVEMHDTHLDPRRNVTPWKTRSTIRRDKRNVRKQLAKQAFEKAYPEHDESDSEEDGGPRTTSTRLPLPRRYRQTKGGSGPRLCLQQSRREDAQAHQQPSSSSSRAVPEVEGLEELERIGQTFREGSSERFMALATVLLTKSLREVALSNETRKTTGATARSPAGFVRRSRLFIAPPRRVSDSLRTDMLGSVRFHMNLFLRIEQDNDIVNVAALHEDAEAVEAYQNDSTGRVPAPGLNPLRPSWSDLKGSYNRALAYQFQEYMIRQIGLDSFLGEDICNAFLERLARLRRVIRRYQPAKGESQADVQRRVNERQLVLAKTSRANGRQFWLNGTRSEISHEYRADRRETEAWKAIAGCLDMLGAEGMSSDDSDNEGGSRTVQKMPWRHPTLTDLVKTVDRDANTKGRFGSSRAGNARRPRIRRTTSANSRRTAPPGLPVNFYDDLWLAGLRAHERLELQDAPAFPIPSVRRQ